MLDINDYQKSRFAYKIIKLLSDTSTVKNITGNKITMFGFAFKKDTSDTLEAPAIHVAKTLLNEGVKLNIYDP